MVKGSNWFEIDTVEDVISPALVVYPDRIEANIKMMIQIAGGTDSLRPHIKTHKIAEIIKQVVGFKGDLSFDRTKLEGSPRKLVDVTRLSEMGWKYSTSLEDGLKKTYTWYKSKIML